jgi:glutamyl-tRNA reductase
MAGEEVLRTINRLPNLGDGERAIVEDLARRIVNKILHDPVKTLREGDQLHSPAGQYLHAIQRIFNLSDEPENPDAEGDAPEKPRQ